MRGFIEFDVIVHPKRKANKWTIISNMPLSKASRDIYIEMYKPPALENDGVKLNFMNEGERYYPRNDDSFAVVYVKK